MGNLQKLLRNAGITLATFEIIGRRFAFESGGCEIAGTITGLRTSDDGLPVIEVSNKTFAGFRIKDIMLHTSRKATLFTTSRDERYRDFQGTFFSTF